MSFFEDAQTNCTAIGNAMRALEAAHSAGEDLSAYISALHDALSGGLTILCNHHGWTPVQMDSGGVPKPGS